MKIFRDSYVPILYVLVNTTSGRFLRCGAFSAIRIHPLLRIIEQYVTSSSVATYKMSSGFSLKLNKKIKSGKDTKKRNGKKRESLFGEESRSYGITKTKLTHVEEYKEELKSKKLIIKPDHLSSTILIEKGSASAEYNTEMKYGLVESSGTNGDIHTEKKSKTNVPLKTSDLGWLDKLPDMTKEDEYEDVPVEEFGQALLRGMGWSGNEEEEGNDQANKRKKVKLPHEVAKPLYSGIGSSAVSEAQLTEKRLEDTFLPLVKINRETGKRAES